jgi:hypothetical protein
MSRLISILDARPTAWITWAAAAEGISISHCRKSAAGNSAVNDRRTMASPSSKVRHMLEFTRHKATTSLRLMGQDGSRLGSENQGRKAA